MTGFGGENPNPSRQSYPLRSAWPIQLNAARVADANRREDRRRTSQMKHFAETCNIQCSGRFKQGVP